MTIDPIFTPEQLSAIENAPLFAGDRHPAWSVLFEGKSAVDFLTRRAIDAIVRSSDLQSRMRGTLDRAVDPSNVPDAAAALAELRALAAAQAQGKERYEGFVEALARRLEGRSRLGDFLK